MSEVHLNATVGSAAQLNAARFGDRLAFQDDFRSVTFSAFAERVRALQNGLHRLGLKKGDRLAFLSKNRIECLELLLAAEAGFIVVPINWRFSPDEIAYVLADCAPTLFVCEDTLTDEVADVVNAQQSIEKRIAIGDAPSALWAKYETLFFEEQDDSIPFNSSETHNAACIVYTSGTTGRPKGAVLSHSALIASGDRIAREMLHLNPEDATLAVMPLFHVGGMWFHCYPSFASGAFTRIQSAFSPEDVLKAICEHRITNVHLAPTMVADILDRPRTKEAAIHLKKVFYAASPMPKETLRRAMQQFPHSDFFQSYGSTEAGPVCWLSPEHHANASQDSEEILSSCGKRFETVHIRIMSKRGKEVDQGEIGEIQVKSTSTMTEYWRNPDATLNAITDGWIATGDLGRRDEKGFLYIVDRKNDMIISGGENVYPTEVEDILHEIPGVAEAAVIGVPDERWVERVVACVVKTNSAAITENGVIEQSKKQLAGYKCPKEVHFLGTLPRNAAGKVLRRRLTERYPFSAPPSSN